MERRAAAVLSGCSSADRPGLRWSSRAARRGPFPTDVPRQTLRSGDVAGVEGRPEQCRLQPRIHAALGTCTFARIGGHRRGHPRVVIVPFFIACPIQAREVRRWIVVVEVELHAGFVFSDGSVEIPGLQPRIGLLRRELLIAATEKASALRGVAGRGDEFCERANCLVMIAALGLGERPLLFHQRLLFVLLRQVVDEFQRRFPRRAVAKEIQQLHRHDGLYGPPFR